ncbi:ABC transporter ATP-binding protein [bacterium]|nr:ABC transporter ATP-binding protein [bacterium]
MVFRNLHPVFRYLRKYWVQYSIGSVFLLIQTWAAVQIPGVVQRAVDVLAPSPKARLEAVPLLEPAAARAELWTFLRWMLEYSVLYGVALFLMRWYMIRASRKIEYDMRHDYFQQLLRLSPSFYDKQSTGDLISRSTNDLNNIREVLGPGIMYLLETAALLPLALALMLHSNVTLTLIGLVPLSLIGVIGKSMGGRLHERFTAVQEQLGTLSAFVQEGISGVRVIKAYTRERYQSERFAEINRELLRRNLAMARLQGIIFPGFTFTASLGVLVLLGIGGAMVVWGHLTLGELIEFQLLMALLSGPMLALGWILNVYQRGDASMARFNEIMAARPEIVDAPDAVAPERLAGEIEFRHLSFAYGDEPVLSDINLRIPAGSTLAIVGHTGSGKTTLVSLLMRLYRPPEGTVFIDGVDVNRYPLEFLRRNIGYVSQEAFLFSDTIAENIAFGRESYTEDEVRRAAVMAHLHDDVEEFPDGYRTRIGERGVTLSGGQRQRAALARALILAPAILILDDVLSAVDTQTEEVILGHLADAMAGRTSIIISHRISTVQTADQIIVLENGRIVEAGTHAQLVAAGGIYAEIHHKQLLSEAIEAE